MESGKGYPTTTTDARQTAPPYPGVASYNATPLPDGYYAAGAPPPYAAGTGQPYPPPPGYPGPMQGQVYYPGQTQPPIVIQQQPNVLVVGQYNGAVPPPDHQALAWFACLCCFWPVGIAAIIKSNEVRNASARGDYAGARIASSSARTLSWVSIGLGVALNVLALIIMFVFLIPYIVAINNHNYN